MDQAELLIVGLRGARSRRGAGRLPVAALSSSASPPTGKDRGRRV